MTPEIAAEIQAQQEHGRAKYGKHKDDLKHDDRHYNHHWFSFIFDHNGRAQRSVGDKRRQHLLKIAGLAVSAIEAYDRRAKK